jgi:hypothetical protein
MLACALGKVVFGSKGLAVFAPETAKAMIPYQVSPLIVEVTEITSFTRGEGATAYHSWMNWPPPIDTCPVLDWNASPRLSFTEKDPPEGQQLQPTITRSDGFVVVSDTEQEVTYPHPFLALPSSDSGAVDVELDEVEEVLDGAGRIASVITPKSLAWEVPKARVADDSGPEVTSYCA